MSDYKLRNDAIPHSTPNLFIQAEAYSGVTP